MRQTGERILSILRILQEHGSCTGVEISRHLGQTGYGATFTYTKRAENYGFIRSAGRYPMKYSITEAGRQALQPKPEKPVRMIPQPIAGAGLMPRKGTPTSVFDLGGYRA